MRHAQPLASLHRPWLGVIVVAAASVAALAAWPESLSQDAFDPRCAVWDNAASEALVGLIHEQSATAEAYLGDAVFRLRRARNNCRHGFAPLARLDYDALTGDRYKFGR